jgi:hypothetical protein
MTKGLTRVAQFVSPKLSRSGSRISLHDEVRPCSVALRTIALAWLGVLASVLLVVGLPLQIAGVLRGPITQVIYVPMLAFEVPLGLWLLIKGVAAPAQTPSA